MVVYSCRIEPGHRAKWYSLASVSELNKIKVVAILCVLRYLAEVFFADRARFLGFGTAGSFSSSVQTPWDHYAPTPNGITSALSEGTVGMY